MFRNFSIGTRLSVGFGSIATLLAALSIFAMWQLSEVRALSLEASGAQAERTMLGLEWRQGIAVNIQRALAVALTSDNALGAHFADAAKAQANRINEIQKRLATIETTPAGVAAQLKLGEVRTRCNTLRDLIFKEKTGGTSADISGLILKFKAALGEYLTSADELAAFEVTRTALLSAAMNARMDSMKKAVIAATSASLIAACILAWSITRGIVRPLAVAQRAADRIAGGDLSVAIEVHGGDEVGRLTESLSKMQDALRSLVGGIRMSVDSIGVASSEVAMGNQDLSARTEQAAASLQQTANSVEQISSAVRQSAETAKMANQLARQASGIATKGGNAVTDVEQTMQGIQDSSKKITDIIGVIEGIAFQTNILALNAAVEAARAGQHGLGFAVVATEVRSLSQRSASAAKEIKVLIDDSVDRVNAGSAQALSAGRTILEVVSSVKRVSDLVGEISAATSEQATGLGEINKSVSTLDQATQQNAALVEESAAAAESLKDQASSLAQSVQRFRLAA
jgi:methyl-accepting chemotaxis protein